MDGVAILYDLSEKQTLHTMKCGEGSITAALFWEKKPVLAMSTGAIKIFGNGNVIGEMLVHAGAATDVSLHPSGDILASVGEDKSIVYYDLTTMKQVGRIFTQSGSCLLLRTIVVFTNTMQS
jgi:pre-mRNA-processing factor 19